MGDPPPDRSALAQRRERASEAANAQHLSDTARHAGTAAARAGQSCECSSVMLVSMLRSCAISPKLWRQRDIEIERARALL
jgi:hypothetical protein